MGLGNRIVILRQRLPDISFKQKLPRKQTVISHFFQVIQPWRPDTEHMLMTSNLQLIRLNCSRKLQSHNLHELLGEKDAFVNFSAILTCYRATAIWKRFRSSLLTATCKSMTGENRRKFIQNFWFSSQCWSQFSCFRALGPTRCGKNDRSFSRYLLLLGRHYLEWMGKDQKIFRRLWFGIYNWLVFCNSHPHPKPVDSEPRALKIQSTNRSQMSIIR